MTTAGVNIELKKKPTGSYLQVTFPYDADLVSKMKEVNSRRWDKFNKRWIVHPNDISSLKSLFPEATIDPRIYEEEKREKLKNELQEKRYQEIINDLDLSKPLPDGKTLFLHQQEAVKRMIRYLRQILAFDMGLGKTLTALVTAKILREKFGWSVVVICPVTLRETWLRDARSMNLQIEVHSWAKVPKPPLKNFILIADEAHYAQSGTKSLRGRTFLELTDSSFCQAVYTLTGTPIKNGRPINLLPLLEACKHSLAADKRHYHIRYCDAHPTRFSKWEVSGAKNLDELYKMTQDVMIRRTKSECLDLPDKLRVFRTAELSNAAKELYDKTLAELKKEYDKRVAAGDIIGDNEHLVILGHLRHAGSIAKTETTIELTREVIEEGGQVIIFTEFRKSAQMMHQELNKSGIKSELLLGDTIDRQGIIDRFQAGQTKVFIGTIKAGGVGITLTMAQTVILHDRPYTPGDAEQAEDRAHRIGQKGNVTAIWIQYGIIDEKIDELLSSKYENIELVLSGKRKRLSRTTTINQIAKELVPDAFRGAKTTLFE